MHIRCYIIFKVIFYFLLFYQYDLNRLDQFQELLDSLLLFGFSLHLLLNNLQHLYYLLKLVNLLVLVQIKLSGKFSFDLTETIFIEFSPNILNFMPFFKLVCMNQELHGHIKLQFCLCPFWDLRIQLIPFSDQRSDIPWIITLL